MTLFGEQNCEISRHFGDRKLFREVFLKPLKFPCLPLGPDFLGLMTGIGTQLFVWLVFSSGVL